MAPAAEIDAVVASFDDVAHLLRRVGFGGTRAEIEALAGRPWPEVVDRVLDTSAAPSTTPGPSLPAPGADLVGSQWGDAYKAMTTWWLDRARTTPVPVIEKLTLFWHGHLPSSIDVVPHAVLFDQNQLYRRRGMGRLDDLMQAMAVHPAMLIYLDNRANVKGHPNENFARELMELFLLGVGNYTETDVRESARAWTGHTMDKSTFAYRFRADWHDDGPKTFMGDTRNWDGPAIIDHLVRGPKQRVTARWIARKLWSFLAYPNPPAALVDDLATSFIVGDMRIDALVEAILLRPEFRSTTAKRGLVRSPFELVVAALRSSRLRAVDVQPQWLMTGMGQELFRPPNVDGWGTNEYWISTTTAWVKATFADRIGWAEHEGGQLGGTRSRSVDGAVDAALEYFGVYAPSTRTRDALRSFVQTERSGRRWAEAWGLTSLVLMSPEFQLA